MPVLTTQAELREAKHVKGLQFLCGDCGQVKEVSTDGFTTGYGYFGPDAPDNKPICYDCCGKRDAADMVETGRATLYLSTPVQRVCGLSPTDKPSTVSNWPGTLRIPCRVRVGSHNIAGKRYDAWFRGPDGRNWHGVTYGDNTQICHCKRLKS